MEELWMELSRARIADLRRSATRDRRARQAKVAESRRTTVRRSVVAAGDAYCARAAAVAGS